MSELIKIETVVMDGVSPKIRKLVENLSPNSRKSLLRQLAYTLTEDAKRNFDDPSNRPELWAPKLVRRNGNIFKEPSNLKVSGMLKNSIKLKRLDSNSAEIFTEPPLYTSKSGKTYSGYGHFHQEGTFKLKRRPYLPITRDGKLTPRMKSIFEAIVLDAIEKK